MLACPGRVGDDPARVRAVVWSDGWVEVLFDDEDAAMLEFFRNNPGQE